MSPIALVTRFHRTSVVTVSAVLAFACACSSSPASSPPQPGSTDGGASAGDSAPSSRDGSPESCGSPGGPAPGPADTHCIADDGGRVVQATNVADCNPDAAAIASLPLPTPNAAALPCYEGNGEFGPPMYGTSGGDDDCKYDVTWSSTPSTFCEGTPIEIVMHATKREDGSPLTGAATTLEITTADCNYAPPGALPNSVEGPAGTYTFGPVAFDRAGQWLVRFHFFENTQAGPCSDLLPSSPHGHAAFWARLP